MFNTTIDQERVARFLAEAHLRSGIGKGANGAIDVCVMQAVDYITGGRGRTDHPECADPVITAFAIRINDAARFAEWRDELKPYAVRIAGTRTSNEMTEKRRWMCADWAIRTIAPLAFEFWAETVPQRRDEALALAAKLRAVAPITNARTAAEGHKVAQKARKAADAADAYAAAAAYARIRRRPSRDAAAFSRRMFDESLTFLERLIAVTEYTPA